MSYGWQTSLLSSMVERALDKRLTLDRYQQKGPDAGVKTSGKSSLLQSEVREFDPLRLYLNRSSGGSGPGAPNLRG